MENDRNTLKTIYSLPSGASLPPRWSSSAAKRLVDLLAAALGLLLLSPALGLLSLLIKRPGLLPRASPPALIPQGHRLPQVPACGTVCGAGG